MVENIKLGKLIGRGNTAEIYDWENNKVLKLYTENFPIARCKEEFANTKNIHAQFGISPNAFDLITIENRSGITLEKISGATMMQEMLSHIWAFKSWSKRLADFHISIAQSVKFEIITVKEFLINQN